MITQYEMYAVTGLLIAIAGFSLGFAAVLMAVL